MRTIIVAYDENRGIGKDGNIPWHIPEDTKLFKETTLNHIVIMGRKTWDSLPERFRPLPHRMNMVVTRNHYEPPCFYDPKKPYMATSLEGAIEVCSSVSEHGEIFIIGGAQIYKEALEKDLVDRIFASEVKGVFDADVFFPDIKNMGWKPQDKKEYGDFTLVTYTK